MADAGHQHRAGASACRRGKRGQSSEAVGRSRGGFGTKIHAACDALGNPVRFILTGGQGADCKQALALLEGFDPAAVLADKAYDSDEVLKAIADIQAEAVIPPSASRIVQRSYDKDLYKERNAIERMFNKLKQFRRVATRYDKLANSFLSFVHIAAICIWLK
jgi:transposase